MNGKWFRQIRAVIRLEMRKTFFSKRGLWVYLLALAPVGLFLAHSLDTMRDREARAAIAAGHPVSADALESIDRGMSIEDVTAKVGEPYSRRTTHLPGRRNRMADSLRYTDGQNDYVFTFLDDELRGISRRTLCNFNQDSLMFAGVFQFFYLRLAIFFGCVGIFMNLFRGEMLDKSLHFYLLAPLRREVLVAGKFLAGLIATVVIFTTSTALQLLALAIHLDSHTLDQYLAGPGWGQIASYLGVTALACLGYGSIFLAAGLFVRNPIIPAAVVLVWEAANMFLPSALKKISVIFYLQSLSPVIAPQPGQDLPGALLLLINGIEPVSAFWAISGLLMVSLAVLIAASLKARKLEINYGTE